MGIAAAGANPDEGKCKIASRVTVTLRNVVLLIASLPAGNASRLWMASPFTKAVHFGVLARGDAEAVLALAVDLGVQLITPDEEQASKALDWTLRLQRAAAYDSFYLVLAETLGCELWTADQRLVNAINQPWVKSVGSS